MPKGTTVLDLSEFFAQHNKDAEIIKVSWGYRGIREIMKMKKRKKELVTQLINIKSESIFVNVLGICEEEIEKEIQDINWVLQEVADATESMEIKAELESELTKLQNTAEGTICKDKETDLKKTIAKIDVSMKDRLPFVLEHSDIAFVTFDTEKSAISIENEFKTGYFKKTNPKHMLNGNVITATRAPEPSDIMW